MRLRLISIVFLIFALLDNQLVHSQPDTLPSDLIFSAETKPNAAGKSQTLLVRVDAQTLEMSTFYADNTASQLRALRWSPDGATLAILRRENLDPSNLISTNFREQICTISRQGILLRCFNQKPSNPYFSNNPGQNNESQVASLAWSLDGKYIYFVQDVTTSIQLIEVNILTGEQSRIVYELPKHPSGYPTLIGISSQITIISTGVGGASLGLAANTPALVSLDTGGQPSLPQALTITSPSEALCMQFSSNGTYATGISFNKDEITIKNTTGLLVARVNAQSGLGQIRASCPTWQHDEQGFYFVGQIQPDPSTQIFYYSLRENSLRVVYRQEIDAQNSRIGTLAPYLVVAQDNQTLAANGMDNFNDPNKLMLLVRVIFPDGHSRVFLSEYYNTQDPLWVPPLP